MDREVEDSVGWIERVDTITRCLHQALEMMAKIAPPTPNSPDSGQTEPSVAYFSPLLSYKLLIIDHLARELREAIYNKF